MTTYTDHKTTCHICDTDSPCPTGAKLRSKEQKQIETKLRKEYQWRKNRYAQSETGLRSSGGNCFNEVNARKILDSLEEQAEAFGVDFQAIKEEEYDR